MQPCDRRQGQGLQLARTTFLHDAIAAKKAARAAEEERLRAAFAAIDTDGSKSLSFEEVLAATRGGRMDLSTRTTKTFGHQLLPSQNSQFVHPLAPLVLLIDAWWGLIGCAFLAQWLGLLPPIAKVRERRVIFDRAGPNGRTSLGTVLQAAPSSSMSYNASEELIAVLRVRFIIVMVAACLVNLFA